MLQGLCGEHRGRTQGALGLPAAQAACHGVSCGVKEMQQAGYAQVHQENFPDK